MSKDKLKNFTREEDLLLEFKRLISKENLSDEELKNGIKNLIVQYEKLLRQVRNLTRVSDSQQKRLNDILDRLAKYVSFQLYKKITQNKHSNVKTIHRKKLIVFFSDIVNFSYSTSNMDGESLSEMLNTYLETMTKIIIKWEGTLDKYMGDGILVYFGDSDNMNEKDNADRCVNMALEMRDTMTILRKKFYNMGYQEPLYIRMGIASGYCTVGNFGSSERMDYTILGTPVNLAFRLQSIANDDDILLSHDAWSLVQDKFDFEPPQKTKLKGFYNDILYHKVISKKSNGENYVFIIDDDYKGMEVKIDFSKVQTEDIYLLINKLKSKINA